MARIDKNTIMQEAEIAVLKEQYKTIFTLLNETGQRISKIEMRLDNFFDKFATKAEIEAAEQRLIKKDIEIEADIAEKIKPWSKGAWLIAGGAVSAVISFITSFFK